MSPWLLNCVFIIRHQNRTNVSINNRHAGSGNAAFSTLLPKIIKIIKTAKGTRGVTHRPVCVTRFSMTLIEWILDGNGRF